MNILVVQKGAFITFERMQPYFKTIPAGALHVGECTTPEGMNPAVRGKVAGFAQTLLA